MTPCGIPCRAPICLPIVWLSPPADGPGKVNENHAASWFSVLTSTSAGEAFARGSESNKRRMPSSASTSLNGCSPGLKKPSTAWSRARIPVESQSSSGVAMVSSAS